MPSPNLLRHFAPDSYYHVYNRSVYGQPLFADDKDYQVFISLFKKHLSSLPASDAFRRPIVKLNDSIELLAYCLLPSHFHLLVFNIKEGGLLELMRRSMTAYSMYFNKRHKRRGVLFESSYKAKMIDDEAYLWHISRYIHLNPQDIGADFRTYPNSSYGYYIGDKTADWLSPERILLMHADSQNDYRKFVADYRHRRVELQKLKKLLAET